VALADGGVVAQKIVGECARDAYFYVYWAAYAIESVLALFIVYGIFRLSMQPLKGLQRFGTMLFCVVAGISVVLAVGYSVINGVVICAILVLWTAYFSLPEPERREIDVSSPLRRWNRICLGWYGM
jgi:uncharacterized membrane protein